MKKGHLLTFAAGLLTLATGAALGDTSEYNPTATDAYYVTVPVLGANPIYSSRTIEQPVRQCTTTTSQHYQSDYQHGDAYRRDRPRKNYIVPGLLGGIVGGLIGNQFGGGHGNQALTVIGAFAGSSIARNSARRHDQSDRYRDYDDRTPSRVCRTTYRSEVVESINGYDVTYEYGGRQFTKRLSERPGDNIRVRVELSPFGAESYDGD